ncbi:MAG: hypothetical protein N2247_00380 [Leptospiraceae bacterium]|nr:hypothetical protein [Leptospiraceae bacterium]
MFLFRIILFSLIFFTLVFSSINSTEPPKESILRIETAMHMAAIRRIGIDSCRKISFYWVRR